MLPCVEPLGSRSSKPATDPVQTQGIAIKVRSPIPVLSIGLDDLPRTLFAGEARASFVTVTNTGQVALANLRAICSHPSFVVFSSEVLQTSRTATTVTISNELTQNLPSPMPQAKVLQPGEAVRLAVLCRGDSGGLHDVLLMFGFEDAVSPSYGRQISATRELNDVLQVTKEVFTAKASHELRVQHSLEFRVQVLQNDSHNAPYAVSLDVSGSNPVSDQSEWKLMNTFRFVMRQYRAKSELHKSLHSAHHGAAKCSAETIAPINPPCLALVRRSTSFSRHQAIPQISFRALRSRWNNSISFCKAKTSPRRYREKCLCNCQAQQW